MTLTTYPDLIQGSEEWLAARRGIVTASVIGQLITPRTVRPASNDYSRALTNTLVAERITGWTEPVYVNHDMLRGTLDEPVARAKYADHYGVTVTEVGFMVLERDNGWRLGYSPDGLVNEDGLIEIKSRKPKTQLTTILTDQVPLSNMAQIQAGLLVTGRAWCDYVSFAGGMPLYVKRVDPDERWFDAITEAVEIFETTAARMVADYAAITEHMPTTERTTYDMEVMV